MSAAIISLAQHIRELRASKLIEEKDDLKEGVSAILEEEMELLSSYRSIADRSTRLLLKDLIREIADDEKRKA